MFDFNAKLLFLIGFVLMLAKIALANNNCRSGAIIQLLGCKMKEFPQNLRNCPQKSVLVNLENLSDELQSYNHFNEALIIVGPSCPFVEDIKQTVIALKAEKDISLRLFEQNKDKAEKEIEIKGKSDSQKQLKVAGIGGPPNIMINKLREDNLPEGIDLDLIRVVAKKLDLQVEFRASDTWGIRLGPGNWTGTFGMVLNGSSDLGVGNVAISHERSLDFDFTVRIYDLDLVMYASKPMTFPPHLSLIKPLSTASWLFFLGTCAIFMLFRAISRVDERSNWLQWLGSLLGQGLPAMFRLKGLELKLFWLLMPWLTLSAFMIMFYDCNLRSHMAVREQTKPIDNTQDALDLASHFFLPRGTIVSSFLKNSVRASDRELYQNMLENDGYYAFNGIFPEEKELLMMEEGASTLSPRSFIKQRANEVIRRYGYQPFRAGKDVIFKAISAFPVRKEWMHLRSFDIILLWLLDTGIVSKITRDNLPPQLDSNSLNKELDVVTLQHIVIGIALWSIGITLATLIHLGERPIANFMLAK